MVDREDLRREQRRMPEGDMGDQRADAQTGRLARKRSEQGPRFVIDDARITEGIDDPGAIEAELLCLPPTPGDLGERPTSERQVP